MFFLLFFFVYNFKFLGQFCVFFSLDMGCLANKAIRESSFKLGDNCHAQFKKSGSWYFFQKKTKSFFIKILQNELLNIFLKYFSAFLLFIS